jgi:mannose-1-phosphate guanylyltransferase
VSQKKELTRGAQSERNVQASSLNHEQATSIDPHGMDLFRATHLHKKQHVFAPSIAAEKSAVASHTDARETSKDTNVKATATMNIGVLSLDVSIMRRAKDFPGFIAWSIISVNQVET